LPSATTHEDIPRLHPRQPLARALRRRHQRPAAPHSRASPTSGARHTQRYRITRLVYCEEAGADAAAAISREKQIKGWRRDKKVALIATDNPTWADLAADWYG